MHFLRQTFKVKVDGQPIERDYAIDWQVESPHVQGLLACSRHWQATHGDRQIPVPSELRHELEENLGIAEQPPNAPGMGPTEDRPRGNARASGTLTATSFKPARSPRTSAEGYLMCGAHIRHTIGAHNMHGEWCVLSYRWRPQPGFL